LLHILAFISFLWYYSWCKYYCQICFCWDKIPKCRIFYACYTCLRYISRKSIKDNQR